MSGAENVLSVDPVQLEAEAAAVDLPPEAPIAGEPGSDAAPGAGEPGAALTLDQAEALAASYEAAAVVLYGQAARIVAPNWNVTGGEVRELAHATAVALAHWFPDQQLPPKYAALLALAGTAYAIAEARRDPATGRIRPLRAPLDDEPSAAAAAPFVAGAGAGFSTAA
jgi:hypothetical protein